MISFSEMVRNLRKERKIPLRKVASFLDIDQAILSKIEHGTRKAKREQVLKLAQFFDLDPRELLVAWMSDNLVMQMEDRELVPRIFEVAEQKILYEKRERKSLKKIIALLQQYFKQDQRVNQAFIFGSYARGTEKPGSDLDLMIELGSERVYTLKDLSEIAHNLESILNIPIDLVEKGYIKPLAWLNVKNELRLIYESGKSK